MQTQPAPIPPIGIAICMVRSPVKLRCGPIFRSSSAAKGAPSGATDAFATPASAGRLPNGTAAPRAAVEVVTRNSLRVGLSEDDIEDLLGKTSGPGYTPHAGPVYPLCS